MGDTALVGTLSSAPPYCPSQLHTLGHPWSRGYHLPLLLRQPLGSLTRPRSPFGCVSCREGALGSLDAPRTGPYNILIRSRPSVPVSWIRQQTQHFCELGHRMMDRP